jgi:hypothetical protein
MDIVCGGGEKPMVISPKAPAAKPPAQQNSKNHRGIISKFCRNYKKFLPLSKIPQKTLFF